MNKGEQKVATTGDSLLSPAATADVEQIGDHKGQETPNVPYEKVQASGSKSLSD
jgi:hypothetical protein